MPDRNLGWPRREFYRLDGKAITLRAARKAPDANLAETKVTGHLDLQC
jgi:hypothetical protein